MNQNIKDRISIQVGLNGYSFRLESDGCIRHSSGWMGAERFFTAAEFQRRYDAVDISVFTPKTALVPEQFYSDEARRAALDDVVALSETDIVDSVAIPELGAVLIYSNSIGETLTKTMAETVLMTDGSKAVPLPEHYHMLKSLNDMTEYNKIIASYSDGFLYLVVAQGRSLLLCNSYRAADFTTAEYFIFLALKKLQLNPEVSAICFRTPLEPEQEMSLYRYFRSVDTI